MERRDSEGPIGYGVVGAGWLGRLCLGEYGELDSVRPVAVADADHGAAKAAAEEFGVTACGSFEALLSRDDVDIVHVATPPFTHRDLTLRALAAGKHVLCEKPLALTPDDGREMIEAARRAERVLAVNLMMRHNPLCGIVKRIIDEKVLGEPVHGSFENFATDERLSPEHWFWDIRKSGGIFIEHAVHFFDLFAWWLGPGDVRSAEEIRRPGAELVEQVSCSTVYRESVIVDFYHGFTQAERMDRQEMRILFERGDVTLHEWVPARMRIDAIVDDAREEALKGMLPGCEVETVATYEGSERRCIGRHKEIEVDRRVVITYDPGKTKMEQYGTALRALMADLAGAIADPGRERLVTVEDALRALETAVVADRLARGAG